MTVFGYVTEHYNYTLKMHFILFSYNMGDFFVIPKISINF
jgi:hypothetical protein